MSESNTGFKFAVTPRLGSGANFTVTLPLSQEEFEDHRFKCAAIHAAVEKTGHKPADVAWCEAPDVSPEFERRLKDAIKCDPGARLLAYYPHSWQHNNYKTVVVDGMTVRYMGFQNGNFIKYAPALTAINKGG